MARATGRSCLGCGKRTTAQYPGNEAVCLRCPYRHPDHRLISRSRAKAVYRLSDEQLSQLSHIDRRNPMYSSKARMVLWRERDVKALADQQITVDDDRDVIDEQRAVRDTRYWERAKGCDE